MFINFTNTTTILMHNSGTVSNLGFSHQTNVNLFSEIFAVTGLRW